MKFTFGLPWHIPAAIFLVLFLVTLLQVLIDIEGYKSLLNFLCAIFALSTILGSKLILLGRFDYWKNILNALWNTEATFVFFFGVYKIFEFSSKGKSASEIIGYWAIDHPIQFIISVCLLSTIIIMRMSFSIAEVFKKEIIEYSKSKDNIESL
ncbi:hypothetical protein MOQ06_20950 [Enterobacter sp. I4]|uniref:hypothetical protein n=1 Tax=Enterobacter TaxID=547 RepID=UPI001F5A5B62|nr:hypothetical protein [Enterobacter sp. I4]MCI2293832.1 hypothetical protein [Enterobacter sp. I4]